MARRCRGRVLQAILCLTLMLVLILYPAGDLTSTVQIEKSQSRGASFQPDASQTSVPTIGSSPVRSGSSRDFWSNFLEWARSVFRVENNFFQEYVGYVRPAWADTSGPKAGGTFATDSSNGGTVNWTGWNIGQLGTSNNGYATATSTSGTQISYYGKVTNFGFSVSGTINGVSVSIERHAVKNDANYVVDQHVKLVVGDAVSGNEKADTSTKWPTSDGTVSYGGSADTWGNSLTVANVQASNFGMVLSATVVKSITTTYASVDYISMTVTYTATVTITWALSGVSNDATGTIIAIDGTNYVYADFPKAFSWTIGSTKSVTATDPVSAGTGKQYLWSSWANGDGLSGASGTYTTPGSAITVTAVYATQWYLTVTSSYGSPTGQGWYTSGSSGSSSVTSPASGGAGVQYLCTGWTGTGSAPASGSSANTGAFTMSAASSVTWNWKTQYQVTFTTSAIGGDTTGTVVTVNGTAKTQAQLPFTAWWNATGSISYAFASPVAATAGKRYVWSSTSGLSQTLQSNIFVVSATGTVTATYHLEWEVTISQSGLGVDVGAGTVVVVDAVNKAKADLPFAAWYDNATSIVYDYTQTIVGGTFQYSLVTVSGCGMSTKSGTYSATATCTLLGNYGVVGGTATVTTTVVQTTTTATTATATTTSVNTQTTTETYTSVTVALTLTSTTTATSTYTNTTYTTLPGQPPPNPSPISFHVTTWVGVVNQTEAVVGEVTVTETGANSMIITGVEFSEPWVTLNESRITICSCYGILGPSVGYPIHFRIAPGLDVEPNNIYKITMRVEARAGTGQMVRADNLAIDVTVNSPYGRVAPIQVPNPTISPQTIASAALIAVITGVIGLGFRKLSQASGGILPRLNCWRCELAR